MSPTPEALHCKPLAMGFRMKVTNFNACCQTPKTRSHRWKLEVRRQKRQVCVAMLSEHVSSGGICCERPELFTIC